MASILIRIILIACFVLEKNLFSESQMLESKCGPLMYKNAEVSINEGQNIAKIICNQNYSNQGDDEVRCINRIWSSSIKPNCVHNDCLKSIPTKNIKNGRFEIYIQDEYFLHYSCNENYVLIGRVISICIDGNWSTHPPICRLKSNVSNIIDNNCLNNSTHYTLENGKVSDRALGKYGDLRLTYTCNKNYKLIGFRIVTCIDGIWMDKDPSRCEFSGERQYGTTTEPAMIECEAFEYKNAKVDISKTGNIATVKCQENYTLFGNSKFYCIRGTWQQRNYPLCVHNDCLPNSFDFALENGKLPAAKLIDDENINLIYNCNEGYKLLGMNTAVCSNGKLLSKPPVCKPKEVEVHQSSIENQSIGCKLFEYKNARVRINEIGNIAKVSCNSNYFLYGYSFYECINGKWEQDNFPRCIHTDCFFMEERSIQDGEILKTSFGTFGEVNVIYDCNIGYNLTGKRMSSCYDGKWTSDPPVCVLKDI